MGYTAKKKRATLSSWKQLPIGACFIKGPNNAILLKVSQNHYACLANLPTSAGVVYEKEAIGIENDTELVVVKIVDLHITYE